MKDLNEHVVKVRQRSVRAVLGNAKSYFGQYRLVVKFMIHPVLRASNDRILDSRRYPFD